MKIFLPILLSSILAISSCKEAVTENKVVAGKDSVTRLAKNYPQDCRLLLLSAKRCDSILMTQDEVNEVSASKAIRAFTDFAFYCKSDSLSPVFLIKTAQVARVINNIPQAKLVLDRCIDEYPSFKDRPAAIFLLAQLYDEATYLNNEREAERLYTKIIEEYPKSDWASSSAGAIRFLGKSDAQIMKELKKK